MDRAFVPCRMTERARDGDGSLQEEAPVKSERRGIAHDKLTGAVQQPGLGTKCHASSAEGKLTNILYNW